MQIEEIAGIWMQSATGKRPTVKRNNKSQNYKIGSSNWRRGYAVTKEKEKNPRQRPIAR